MGPVVQGPSLSPVHLIQSSERIEPATICNQNWLNTAKLMKDFHDVDMYDITYL